MMPEDPLENSLWNRDESFETHYEAFEQLGSGQFAVVRRCVHRISRTEFAAKFIQKRRWHGSRRGVKRPDIEREVQVLRAVGGHGNVIALHDVFESPTEIILVLELVSGGELFDHVYHREFLPELEASAFIRQILSGLQHLHERHIAHLDIKPENIMLLRRGEPRIKLIDFGLSRQIPPGTIVKDMIGTPEFVAPEIVNYDPLSTATDMWALGVVTYILLSGASPFLGSRRDETFHNITACAYRFDDEYFADTSDLAKDFIRRLFIKDTRKRMTVQDCMRHRWIAAPSMSDVDLIKESEVNMQHVRSFKLRRKWKHAIRAVVTCNRLTSHMKVRTEQRAKMLAQLDRQLKSTWPVNSPHRPAIGRHSTAADQRRYFPLLKSENLLVSALLCASEEGNTNGLEQLGEITNRLDYNMANELGETAMHVGAGAGQKDVLQYLQIKGARVDIVDAHGDTPLHWGARHGHPAVVRYLCDETVNVNPANRCNETPLHVASRYGQTEVAHILCENGANVNIQDEHGETSVHVAAWHGYALLMDVLCRYKPNPALPNKDEETALHCASARGHIECVESLLECADPPLNLQDKNGQTPLHLALNRRHLDIARLLMTKGCRLDVQDSNGDTPLHIACRQALLSAAQTLCHLGAPVDVLNTQTQSPLHLAASDGHLEIVRVLCLSGANLNARSRDGHTAESMATAAQHTNVAALLARLKNDAEREQFIDELCPMDAPLKRIKLKLFGHSGAGKSALCHTLQTGVIGGILDGLSRRWSERDSGVSGESGAESSLNTSAAATNNNNVTLKHDSIPAPTHSAYTRGIDVQKMTVPGAGEFSCWEFGGYESYHCVYDHFVGNTDCVHVILFRADEPTEVQYQQVLYWINFLTSRITPSEPIGHCGVCPRRSCLVLVATHVDVLQPAVTVAADGSVHSSDADALLSTVMLRYQSHFDIHDRLIHVDAQQPSGPGMKALRAYLTTARATVLGRLPHALGLLEHTQTHVASMRRRQPYASLPVCTWPQFMHSIRADVNPLASEAHCRQLMQQLQLTGEVVYLKDEMAEIDYVVLSADWLGTHIIGTLLCHEHLMHARVTGTYAPEDFASLYPEIPGEQLLQLLDTLHLCTLHDDIEYEFAAFNVLSAPADVWAADPTDADALVYGGMRLQVARGMHGQWRPLFPRLQTALRRSMQDFQDPMDAELQQWAGCSKLASGRMEALVSLVQVGSSQREPAVELIVRGPADEAASCFYFMEDMANLIEQTAGDVAPGLPIERHLLSARQLKALEPQQPGCSLVVYTPDAVMDMQRQEAISICSSQGTSELFTDVVCFGCTDVTSSLTLGIDVSVAQLPLAARRELAALLDPADAMGRDWSILAVKLSLTDQLPDVDSTGPQLSRTDQLLAEWALVSNSSSSVSSSNGNRRATVGGLCDVLEQLGRQDAVQALYRQVPLYLVSTAGGGHGGGASASTAATQSLTMTMDRAIDGCGADSGVASSTGTSNTSGSTLSR